MNTETTKVLIENWPNSPWLKDWIPILIAVIALITSIVSLYWTRKEFIKSSRPYVWASNYRVIDSERKTIIAIPSRFAFRVKNNPARIIRVDIEIKYNTEKLFSYLIENIVRFPDETSEWNFSIDQEEFQKIMNRSDADKRNLTRMIYINYSSLNGGRIYKYKLIQSFEPLDNQWKDISESAD
ncbi:hypothetical protein [Microbacter margulisiae]|uniref:Uncharacterized protein n=1 Tax=Microbacter margulisiae TaxID=1350067 RepID=A0A7W5DNR1_9PORP|nr:hypothetical protein [Microbacter margulisiae]MBB3186236.1 hypothetical protein [Microbacter margulisiae]